MKIWIPFSEDSELCKANYIYSIDLSQRRTHARLFMIEKFAKREHGMPVLIACSHLFIQGVKTHNQTLIWLQSIIAVVQCQKLLIS